jgi:hypothetical protein
VIPTTALGLVVFLAALGPGYVYLRVAERRGVRPERSGLLEAVELAVVGAFASTVATLAVFALADAANVINIHVLGGDPQHYAEDHPLRLLWLVAVTLLTGYAFAWTGARLTHLRKEPNIVPGGTAWGNVFNTQLPHPYDVVRVTVELRDGRKLTGPLGGFTTHADADRELCLAAPILVQLPEPGAQTTVLEDDFLAIREADILAISGKYLPGQPPPSRPPAQFQHSGIWRKIAGDPSKAASKSTQCTVLGLTLIATACHGYRVARQQQGVSLPDLTKGLRARAAHEPAKRERLSE